MPQVGFEHTILLSERPQTHALDRMATGIGYYSVPMYLYIRADCMIGFKLLSMHDNEMNSFI
jgi:hypothetical protein